MNTYARGLALLLLALPAWTMAQTTPGANRIGGSIYPALIKPTPLPVPGRTPGAHRAFWAPDVQAVCLGSSAHADRCPAQANLAFCDIEDTGLARCLAHYAKALVRQPVGAKRALSFTVRDAHDALSTVTVLATLTQSDAAIAKAALDGRPGAAIVAMRMPIAETP